MILIGMFDSPFVRRVAVTMNLLAIPFEHRNWSVGKDFDRVREFNPLGRVPTLVLADGESLIESAAILDYLDDFVGPKRALLPPSGRDRREHDEGGHHRELRVHVLVRRPGSGGRPGPSAIGCIDRALRAPAGVLRFEAGIRGTESPRLSRSRRCRPWPQIPPSYADRSG